MGRTVKQKPDASGVAAEHSGADVVANGSGSHRSEDPATQAAALNGAAANNGAQSPLVVVDPEEDVAGDYGELLAALRDLAPISVDTESNPIHLEPTVSELEALKQLFASLPEQYGAADRELLLRAYAVASYAHREQFRNSGEPYVTHPIAVTTIVAGLNMDPDT